MTTAPEFCKILVASDGHQVLFVLDRSPEGHPRIQGVTDNETGLITHSISFEGADGFRSDFFNGIDGDFAETMRTKARGVATPMQ